MKKTNHPFPFKRSPFWIQPGLALVLAWAATTALRAQDHTYSDGEDYSTPLDTGTGITLTVPVGAATQSGPLTGSGTVTVNPTSSDLGKLTLTATSYYSGAATVDFGTLAVSGSSAQLDARYGDYNNSYLYGDYNNSSLYVGSADGDKAALEISSGGKAYIYTNDLGHDVGSQGTATVTGVSSRWGTQVLTVGNNGNGTLTVSNGGYLQNDSILSVGKNSGGMGILTVDGGDSTLYVGNRFFVGDGGNGTLAISNGAVVSAGNGLTLGNLSGSTGTATVTGASSTVYVQNLSVGDGGSGTLTISNGGRVSSYYTGEIGNLPGGTGQVTVDGAGSIWTSNYLHVNNGTLTMTHGGQVSSNYGNIGNLIRGVDGTVKGTGSVTVDGVGSAWTPYTLNVGNGGNGTLTICNGGQVASQIASSIGTSGGVGDVTVTGVGSLWTVSAFFPYNATINVGDGGTGSLTVSHGGKVSTLLGYIGTEKANSLGSVTVDGAGSLLSLSSSDSYSNGNLYVGYGQGNGTLMISHGGKVSDGYGYIGYGYNAPTLGSVTVDGTGSLWTNDSLYVGYSDGNGTLSITHGGYVSSNSAYVGYNNYGTTGSSVTVDGTGSTWATSYLAVGNSGKGTLTISNGGQVLNPSGYGYVGYYGPGSATVDGAGSLWTNGALYVGAYSASGSLTISNGGKVSDQSGTVGGYDSGSVTVDGVGSLWTNSGDLYVGGYNGVGTLTISHGGQVSDQNGYLGQYSTTSTLASATVTGSNSSWANSTALYVGGVPFYGRSNAALTISDGGTVTSPVTYLANIAGAQATVNLNSGGILATGQVVAGDGAATLNFDGGILRATAASTDFLSNFSAGGVTMGSGGATIDNNGYAITVNSALSGTGGITSTGAGTLTLTATSTFGGNTTVRSGTLALAHSGAALVNLTGTTYVGSVAGDNATLALSGGGVVTDSYGSIGESSGSTGIVTITGSDSAWNNLRTFVVGNSGNGTLTVAEEGVIYVAGGPLTLASLPGSSGTLNIGNGGLAGAITATTVTGGAGTAVVNFNESDSSYLFRRRLTGTLAVKQIGTGMTVLTGSNTYTGGTLVSAGTLAVGNNSALGTGTVKVAGGTLLIQQGFTVANTITLSSGGILAQQTAAGSSYSALHAFTGNADGSPVTTAQFLGGQAGGATTVSGDFSLTSGAENDDRRVSEVFHLGGVSVVDAGTGQTDIFVLQLQLAPSLVDSTSYLGWLDPETNLWTNAVDGNFGGTATFVEGSYDPATDFQLGFYGVNPTSGAVWAVLDHNSSFAVVPEPSTWILLGLGLAGLFFYRSKSPHRER